MFIKGLFFFFVYYSGLAWLSDYIFFEILKRRHIPILTYHSIVEDKNSSRPGRRIGLMVSKDTFDRQIDYLMRRYRIIPLSGYYSEQSGNSNDRKRPVIITFDDGYRDNYINAFPVLKRYNAAATIFLATGYIGSGRVFPWHAYDFLSINNKVLTLTMDEFDERAVDTIDLLQFRRHAMLSINEIQEMSEFGIEFGGHTITHPVLSGICPVCQAKEIIGSLLEVEEITGKRALTFAYPYGQSYSFNRESVDILEEHGVNLALANWSDINDEETDRFRIKRIIISDEPMYIFRVRLSILMVLLKRLKMAIKGGGS